MIVTMSTKGQVVIPKSLRDELGLKENSPLSMHVVDGALVAKPLDEERIRKDLEKIREIQRKAPKLTDEQISQIVKDVRAKIRAEGRNRH